MSMRILYTCQIRKGEILGLVVDSCSRVIMTPSQHRHYEKESVEPPFKAHRYRSSQKPCRQVPPEQEELSMQAVQRVFPVAWESK